MVQGLSGAAGAVVVYALIRDLFDKEAFARTTSFVVLIMTLAPLMAPLIGGYLSVWLGWRSIFWFLAIFAAIVVCSTAWKIPGTLARDKRNQLNIRSIFRNFVTLLKYPVAMGLAFCAAFSYAAMFAFLTAVSFVYIDLYGVSPQHFGYLFGLNVIMIMIITAINGRYVSRFGVSRLLEISSVIQSTAGVLMVFAWRMDLGIWGLVPFVMLMVGNVALIYSNSMSLLLSRYPTLIGTASSVIGPCDMGRQLLLERLLPRCTVIALGQ